MRADMVFVVQVTHCVPQRNLLTAQLTHRRAPVQGLASGVRPEAIEVPQSAVGLGRVVHKVLRPGEKVVLFVKVSWTEHGGGDGAGVDGRVRGRGAGHLVDDGHGVL